MTSRPYRSCMPLHLMDSDPRDELPEPPEDYEEDADEDGLAHNHICQLCGIEITPHERRHRCPQEE